MDLRAVRVWLWFFVLAGAAHSAKAEMVNLPPPYVAQQQVTGVIRIWGHGALAGRVDFIEKLVRAWEAGFQRLQPGVQFENHLTGTAAAMGAVYTGAGDLALMGREIWPHEIAAFEEVFHYPPTGLDVVTGSFNVRNRGYAMALFVHKDNPLAQLTLEQVDAVYGADHLRGPKAARTWGDLGLTGAWADKPIHPFGPSIARGFADFIEEAVLRGSRKWNPDVREFPDQPGSTGGGTDGGQMMLDALSADPLAIALSGAPYSHPDAKPLALATSASEPYFEPTRQNVIDHTYPLKRMITMYLNRAPGEPADPKLAEFLRYVLSREAQEAVLREGDGYLPVVSPFAERELQKLK